jgi:hypothetical protein
MAPMAIVRSQSAAGRHYEIMLQKTAPDRGMIRIKSWRKGQDPERSAPAKQDSYKLYKIRLRSASTIVCRGDVFGPHPVVTCSLEAGSPSDGPFVQVDVVGTLAGAFDGSTRYPIAPAEYVKLEQFLAEAAFPPAGR